MDTPQAPNSAELYEALVAAVRRDEPVALCTVVRADGEAPQRVGAKLLAFGDGRQCGTVGGGAFEARVLREAHEALALGVPRLVELDLADVGMICGGRMAAYIDVMVPPPRLVLFGGGHVAWAIAHVAQLLDFRITVVDERPEWANAERFPRAELAVQDFGAFLDGFESRPSDCLVIVTRGHAHDEFVLRRLIGRPCAYLGMIGSAGKVGRLRQRLVADGIAAADLDRLDAPLGLRIGSRTPAEVAVSLCARLVALRRGVAPEVAS